MESLIGLNENKEGVLRFCDVVTLGIVNFSPAHEEASDEQLAGDRNFGAGLTAQWQQSSIKLSQMLIIPGRGLARLHQQITLIKQLMIMCGQLAHG